MSSAQSSSAQDRIQQRTEQVVDALDKKLTDSLWAVTRNCDKETRQATQVKTDKSKANSRQDKSNANSRQDKSKANRVD